MSGVEQIEPTLKILPRPAGRGRGRATVKLIDACLKILEEIQPATVRAVCYRLFVAKVIPNMSKASTSRVSRALTKARESDDLPWEWIVDETREVERIATWDSVDQRMHAIGSYYRRDYWRDQPTRVEVWSEKGTVRGTLKPVLDEYGVAFRVMHGYGSATAVYDAARDSDDAAILALYVGDYDPSGMHMSEEDLPLRLDRYDGNVKIRRISLTQADCASLPHFDVATKAGDKRHGWFKRTYGSRCWELDAMSPVALRDRVKEHIVAEIDQDAWRVSLKSEKAEQETLLTVSQSWQKCLSTKKKISRGGCHGRPRAVSGGDARP